MQIESMLHCRPLQREFKDLFADFIDSINSSEGDITWELVSAALQNPFLEDPENSWWVAMACWPIPVAHMGDEPTCLAVISKEAVEGEQLLASQRAAVVVYHA